MKKIILAIFCLTLFYSCTKDVFESSPSDKYDETAVWSNPNLVDFFINEVYNGMGMWVTDGLCWDSMTDQAYSMFNWAGDQLIAKGVLDANVSQRVGVNYNKGGDSQSGLWGYMFKKIRATNVFFERVDAVPSDQSWRDVRKGEMHFLRAYFYSKLANTFGNVPIITSSFGLDNDILNVTQSDFKAVSAFVDSELDLAITLLPSSQSEPGRITKAAAMALKAEQLLYTASPYYNGGSYDQATLKKAKAVNSDIMATGLYQLTSEYSDATRVRFNSEIILARYMSANRIIDRDNTMDRDLASGGTGGYTSYTPLQTLVDNYEVIDGSSTFIPATWSNNVRTVTTNPKYDDNNPYVNRDPRFYATVYFNGAKRNADYTIESYVGGKDSRQSTVSAWWNNTWSSYYVAKFVNQRDVNAFPDRPFSNTMWVEYRLGEVYLNQAEILYALGESDSNGNALWYVNQIRTRAGMPALAALDADKLRHERNIELAFEGKRFQDLRRWGIYHQVMKTGQWGLSIAKQTNGTFVSSLYSITAPGWNDKFYWIPIPQVEMNKNPNLIQAPGW
jgi:starch-binding outer membrane protein, SusD/RagB family